MFSLKSMALILAVLAPVKLEFPAATPKSWPLFRGTPGSSAVAPGSLPKELDLLWTYRVKEGAFEATAAIEGGIVFLADLDGAIYALDLKTGKEKWKHKVDSGFIAAPAVFKNQLFVGDYDGMFYCLDAKTGKVNWKFETQAEIDSSANFYKERVLVGSQDATLYCLNTKDGSLVWKHQIEDQIRCTPTIVENRAFLAGCDGKLHIINLDNGKTVNSVPIDGPTGVTPAVHGKNVFFGTEGGIFYCIDWSEAKTRWTFKDTRRSQAYRSSAAVNKDIIVVGSRSKRIYGITPKGEKKWEYVTKSRIDSSPVIVGDRAYVGSTDGRLYAIDLAKGKLLWEHEAGGGFIASPAIADGKLVISNDEGVVFCFGKKK